MCGIVGIIDYTNVTRKQNIESMLRRIYLRGPDGEGRYSDDGIELGMRRLSIIDIEGGQQPFYSGNGQIVAFQNGEIYNYKELTKELQILGYQFVSHSDTEVIAHGYHAWGIRLLLQKLEGMYAISILDKTTNKLYLARDRFGEKPLYYSYNKNTMQFAYSSDLRSLLELDWIPNKLSPVALSRYLMLGFTTDEQSIIAEIKKVLPSHYLELDIEPFELHMSCYYLPNLESVVIEEQEVEKALDELLNNSIDLRLQSDVPVGIFLSGGIDSSLIAAISAKKHPQIDTFSIGFHSDKYDESKYAKDVAKHIGSRHHHFMFDENHFVDLLPIVISELDEPLADQACLPTFWLSKEARKHVAVVLSGEGGDEVFGGYSYYKQFEKKNHHSSLVNNMGNITPSGFPLLMSLENCKYFMNIDFNSTSDYEQQLFDWMDTGKNGVQKAMVTDLMTWLPDNLLVKLDRMAMANSLEGRTPYLSHHLINFSYSLDKNQWIQDDEYKVLLRKIGKQYLPKSIFERPKQGFILPMDEWIREWFKKESVDEFFITRKIDEIDTKKIIQFVKNELTQKSFNQRLVFALIMLYKWVEINLNKDLK